MTFDLKALIAATVLSAVAIMSTGVSATPTQAQVDRARAECAQHKARVNSMEMRCGCNSSAALDEAKRRWEDACARADMLMEERRGISARDSSQC